MGKYFKTDVNSLHQIKFSVNDTWSTIVGSFAHSRISYRANFRLRLSDLKLINDYKTEFIKNSKSRKSVILSGILFFFCGEVIYFYPTKEFNVLNTVNVISQLKGNVVRVIW